MNWRPGEGPSRTYPLMSSRPPNAAGFSLLELMVVLALVGLLAIVALPNLPNLLASATRATERESILDQFAALGTEATLRGWDQVIVGTVGETAELDDEEVRALGTRYLLDLPEGWDVRLDRPLIVRANGVCLGAKATILHNGSTVDQLALTAPLCKVRR